MTLAARPPFEAPAFGYGIRGAGPYPPAGGHTRGHNSSVLVASRLLLKRRKGSKRVVAGFGLRRRFENGIGFPGIGIEAKHQKFQSNGTEIHRTIDHHLRSILQADINDLLRVAVRYRSRLEDEVDGLLNGIVDRFQ